MNGEVRGIAGVDKGGSEKVEAEAEQNPRDEALLGCLSLLVNGSPGISFNT